MRDTTLKGIEIIKNKGVIYMIHTIENGQIDTRLVDIVEEIKEELKNK